MFGVTPGDGFQSLSERDVRYGLEIDKRNQILRTFIRNTYNYHLTEILATVINEYTNWDQPNAHPLNTRDETLLLLSDALYTAPVLHMGSLYATAEKPCYFYVFDHFTRFHDYSRADISLERMGSIHGEELPYVWGAPLAAKLNHFTNNFTQAEVKLSEAMLAFWSNFARSGNPNDVTDREKEQLENSRYRTVEWPPYDSKYRKYLDIGLKPRVKDHYRSHQLSFWLQLIPQLHRSGEDASDSHNHLSNHDDWSTYIGYVRSQPVTRVILPPDTTTAITTTHQYNVSAVLQSTPASGDGSKNAPSIQDGFAAYSTALSVTIAIGCSLLILNILIFAGVYYQRDKSRSEAKKISENGGLLTSAHSISGDFNTPSEASTGGIKVDMNTTSTSNGGSNGSSRMALQDSSSSTRIPPSTPIGQTHLPPPEFADYPVVTSSYGGSTNLPTLARESVKQTSPGQKQVGSSLTLSVPRAPAPPRIPVNHVSEAQPLLQQSSLNLSTSHSVSKSPPSKEVTIGELRV